MARSYGVLKTSVWEPGSEFRSLSPMAQWTFAMLISQPQISNLGVLAYTPEKWARLAAGLTLQTLEDAIAELELGRYVIVDLDTAELLVRTFVRHDKVWSQPKLVTNARKLIREVESQRIRKVLVDSHPWLLDNATKDEIVAYEEAAERGSDTPSDRGIERGFAEGVSEGVSIPGSPPRAPAGAGAGVGSSSRTTKATTTEASYAARDDEQDAAAADTSTEAPRESRIAEAIAQLPGADLDTHRVVEPLARQLPRVLFDDIEARLRDRIRTGSADNPPGLFVDMLRTALKQQTIRSRPAAPHLTHRERIELEARSYATAGHDWHVVEPLLHNNLRRHTAPDDELLALMDAARAAYLEADQQRARA